MFTLDGIKMVVFDFDDTLYIHPTHKNTMSDEEFCKKVCTLGAKYYPPQNFSMVMKKVMDECDRRGILMALCSHTSFFPMSITKIAAVKEAYGYELINLCVGDAKAKHIALRITADSYGFCPSEVMLIDDLSLNLRDAETDGFKAASPMEIYKCEERGVLFKENLSE